MRNFARKEILMRLRAKIDMGRPVIAGGAGLGIVGRMQEEAGIDLVMAYNTGPYRMDGNPSFVGHMAYGNCNETTLRLVDILANSLSHTPIVAGVGAGDPFLNIPRHIETLCYHGASGITNVPTVGGKGVGALQGPVRDDMEANGFGFDREVRMIRYCRQSGILTVAYAFETEQVKKLVQAGVDIIAPHVGGTAGGLTGFKSQPLEEAAKRIQKMHEAAIKENPDIIVLCHGGPLENPESVKKCMELTKLHGFIGASTLERIPVEKELLDVIGRFKRTRPRQKEVAE